MQTAGNHARPYFKFWRASVVLVAIAIFLLLLAIPRHHSPRRITISIDTNGSARIGVLSLQNKMVRASVLKAIQAVDAQPNLAIAENAGFTNVLKLIDSMAQAGISNVSIKVSHEPKRDNR